MISLILASASPRRLSLLRQIGIECEVLPVDLDEQIRLREPADEYVLRLAREKAEAAVAQASIDLNETAVLAADTAVVLDGDILGKPADRFDALAMLARLSGRTHKVMTGVAVRGPAGAGDVISTTEVSFRTLVREECERYWLSGEPADKAGAYAIQGMGALFVTAIAGSYSGVVGLPLLETGQLLHQQGVSTVLDTGRDPDEIL